MIISRWELEQIQAAQHQAYLYRLARAEGKLDEASIAALDEVGFDWQGAEEAEKKR